MPKEGFRTITLKDGDTAQIEKIAGNLPVPDAAVVRAALNHAAHCKHFDLTVEA